LCENLAQHCLCLLIDREIQSHLDPVFGSIGSTPLEHKARSLRAYGVNLDIRHRQEVVSGVL
jgi:hypothetical protein